ncbi:hypothetical protein FACS189454_06620 [Planctomycetales bacterium]|nr:hypothetical protein FACS189454_06620 [Planctomycetales bacterium]
MYDYVSPQLDRIEKNHHFRNHRNHLKTPAQENIPVGAPTELFYIFTNKYEIKEKNI